MFYIHERNSLYFPRRHWFAFCFPCKAECGSVDFSCKNLLVIIIAIVAPSEVAQLYDDAWYNKQSAAPKRSDKTTKTHKGFGASRPICIISKPNISSVAATLASFPLEVITDSGSSCRHLQLQLVCPALLSPTIDICVVPLLIIIGALIVIDARSQPNLHISR